MLMKAASKRHKNRFANFVQDIQGLTLDIGSDRPSISCKLLPESCDYIGLDPYADQENLELLAWERFFLFRFKI